MQTFFPFINLVDNAKVLDNKRLNKQILEGYQILKVLSGASPTGGWRNHPAVLMWKGHEYSLRTYVRTMVTEANIRGIKTENNVNNLNQLEERYGEDWGTSMPKWFRTEEVKRVNVTHRARLYVKDPIYYEEFREYVDSPLNLPCCKTCSYYWPTHMTRDNVLHLHDNLK